MRKISLFLAPAIFLIFNAQIAGAAAFDFSDWDALLKKYVYEGTKEDVRLTLVKYSSLKKDHQFKDLIHKLEKFSTNGLEAYNEKLSFWINVYNIMAIKMVSDHYPIESIKDIGDWFAQVWNKNAGVIGGKVYSLSDIEHGILRKMREPHIHAAIVCASISCPDIVRDSYKPDILSAQLDNQIRRLLANKAKGFFVNEAESSIYISPIFKWFKKDFQANGGVINCLKRHAPKEKRKYLKYVESGDYTIKYLDFNWDLNG